VQTLNSRSLSPKQKPVNLKSRILIITDDACDAQKLMAALVMSGYEQFASEWVTRLSEAISRLKTGSFDAVLVDLLLPDSMGIRTFEKLFSIKKHVSIMVLCPMDDDADARAAVNLGAQGYFTQEHFGSYLIAQTLNNVIQQKQVEENFFIEKTRAILTLNSISDAVIGTDMLGNVEYLNIAAERMTGWTREEAHGHAISEVMNMINSKTRLPVLNPIELVLRKKVAAGLPANTYLIRRDGYEIAIEDSSAPIHDLHGQVFGAVIVFHDVTASQAMIAKMAHLAQYDFLTNLPNSALLGDRIAQAITLAKRHKKTLAVLFLDLDNFKHINDSLGHAAGDKLLQCVAGRLAVCVRSSDTVSRQGGDEFVVLLSEDNVAEDAILIADKILIALAGPYVIDKQELHVTTSIGISVYPVDGIDTVSLLKNADTAMYQAKQKGRNNYQFFKHEMNVHAVERQVIETDLRHALERQELLLYYQPKVNLKTGKLTGAEALLRWVHPKWGLTLPIRFVPIAEESGLIIPIGRWVLQQACQQIKNWEEAGLSLGSVAVNISALEFRHKNFIQGLRDVLHETGIAPYRLQLEITESVLMRDAETSATILHQLKNMGVALAVDDFGTGYSSLSYLNHFPIDVLKIDRSFVRDIGTIDSNNVIVSAIIGIGINLHQRVVAEGIETQAQLDFLQAHDCQEGQGDIFSPPLVATDFAALLGTGHTQESQFQECRPLYLKAS
jgi:diguanylate cyclase (GGDEF)-like protein/PAS domain S-box-containing protein